jgi:hypothetical protein
VRKRGRVLENVGEGKRTMRKPGGRRASEAQDLHQFHSFLGKGCGKERAASGKGGLSEAERGSGENLRCTDRMCVGHCVRESEGEGGGGKIGAKLSGAEGQSALVVSL